MLCKVSHKQNCFQFGKCQKINDKNVDITKKQQITVLLVRKRSHKFKTVKFLFSNYMAKWPYTNLSTVQPKTCLN